MAKRVGNANAAPKQAQPSAPKGADDLPIIYPNAKITIADRELLVHEYGFEEGLRLSPMVKPITDALHALVKDHQEPDYDDIVLALSVHHDELAHLIAAATDTEPEWVAALSGVESDQLMFAWWSVNGPFFLGRVTRCLAMKLVQRLDRARKGGRGGAKSLTPSPTQDTASPTNSAATPGGS